MKLFQKVIMASENVQSLVRSGKFMEEDAPAPVSTGACVVAGDLVDHAVYDGIKDFNVRELTAPAAQTDSVVLVDYVGVSEVDVVGVNYRVGSKVWGYDAPAGTVVRYRIPERQDMFWLGADNFTTAPTVGQFAAPTANDTRLTPGASEVEGAFNVKIEDEADIITGMVNNGKKYLCTVVSVV